MPLGANTKRTPNKTSCNRNVTCVTFCDVAPNQTLTKPKCTAVRLTAKQQALVVKFMPMVHSLAWRALKGRPKNILQEDLAAAGMIGLCEAARRFDETRGVSFMSYAWPDAQGLSLIHI